MIGVGIKIKCKLCGDIIQSPKVGRMVWCKCKKCAVDGAVKYSRLIGNPEDYEVVKDCCQEDSNP